MKKETVAAVIGMIEQMRTKVPVLSATNSLYGDMVAKLARNVYIGKTLKQMQKDGEVIVVASQEFTGSPLKS